MVVLIIQVEDFSLGLVDPERDPPVARDMKAPCPLAVAGELVRFPTRHIAEFLRIFHLLQEGQNVSDLLHDTWSQAGSIIALDEAPQSTMDRVSDLHSSCYWEGCRLSSDALHTAGSAAAFDDGRRER